MVDWKSKYLKYKLKYQQLLKQKGGMQRETRKKELVEKIMSGKPKVSLERLNLSDDDAEEIAEILKTNNTLKVLWLWHNNISDRGAKALAEAIKQNNTIEKIFLEDNNIGIDGIVSLVEALSWSTTITDFTIWRNLSDDDYDVQREMVKHIVLILRENKKS